MGRGLGIGFSKTDGEKRVRTQLGEDIPEPVQDEHRGDAVSVRWMGRRQGELDVVSNCA